MSTRAPLIRLYQDEAVADLFAGGGGASTGIEMVLGRSPDIAINHDADALAMHEQNHPGTEHLKGDVFNYDPDTVATTHAGGRRFAFAWFSPDCTYHSKAKGGKPFRDKRKSVRIRGLAWVMVHWAESTIAKPRCIFMENVEELEDWGPLIEVGRGEWKPDPTKRGTYWKRLVRRLKNAGYDRIEWRKLRASHYGAPTSRQRMVMIARCDGLPIVWPEPTHGPKRTRPFRTAAECIDFNLPVPSIFLTPEEAKEWGRFYGVPAPKRPLADNTLRRVARGVVRYVIEAVDPFIIPIGENGIIAPYVVPPRGYRQDENMVDAIGAPLRTIKATDAHVFGLATPFLVKHYGGDRGQNAGRFSQLDDPMGTVTTSDHHALVVPTLINTRNGERHGRHGEQAPRVLDIQAPYPTITALGSQGALVAAFLAKHNAGHEATGQHPERPLDTVTTRDTKALVTAHLTRFNTERTEGSVRGQGMREPLTTLDTSNRFGLVTSNLVKLRGGLLDHVHTSQDVREPVPTLTAGGTHLAEVRAFLVKFFGTGVARSLWNPLDTVTTKDRVGLVIVTIAGEEYVLVDIGMRMLTPRELFLAQGFPRSYVIDRGKRDGVTRKFTKGVQTRLVGNSVPPHLAAAVISANLGSNVMEAIA